MARDPVSQFFLLQVIFPNVEPYALKIFISTIDVEKSPTRKRRGRDRDKTRKKNKSKIVNK